MASTTAVPTPQIQLEDPLAHLPCSTIVEYRKGQTIYNQNQPSTSLYLVMDGMVKISRITDDGRQVMIDIYQRDEFFGESALLNLPQCTEQATALEGTKVMMWTASAIDEIVKRRPRLAVALMQILVQRTINFTERLESFSTDNIQRRLARSLIRFSERFGRPGESGSVGMLAFTHELLAQYVGTSREIITHYMTRFRREGYMQYSRKEIVLRPEAFGEWLRQNASAGQRAAASATNADAVVEGMDHFPGSPTKALAGVSSAVAASFPTAGLNIPRPPSAAMSAASLSE